MITQDKAQQQTRENGSLNELNKPVRVHANLCPYSWAKLWYLCRRLDKNGKGWVILSFYNTMNTLDCDRSTLYRWLKEGKKAGAFRSYNRPKGSPRITIYYGGKSALTTKLNLEDWGPVREVSLDQVLNKQFYKQAAITRALDNQRKSRRAAIFNLPKEDKKQRRKVIEPESFYRWATTQESTYPNLAEKDLKEKFHILKIVGDSHLFALCRLCFIPTGASQDLLSKQINKTDRTVRNHLIGIDRIQLCYPIDERLYDAEVFFAAEAGIKPKVFRAGKQCFKYGTNIYNLDFDFKSEKIARLKHKFNLLKARSAQAIETNKKNLSIAQLNNEVELINQSNNELKENNNFLRFIANKETEKKARQILRRKLINLGKKKYDENDTYLIKTS